MRICIITLPLHTNYGGILQAYALQTILQRMGHTVSVVDTYKRSHLPVWRIPLSYGKRFVQYFLGKNKIIFREKEAFRQYQIISQNTTRFIEKNIHRTMIRSFRELKSSEYDAIVVGSDQVWRPKYFSFLYGAPVENAFLEFAKKWDVIRVAYAASFGTDMIEYSKDDVDRCLNLLSRFDGVSVRENSGVQICNDLFHINSMQVLDPTLLLTSDDYKKLIEDTSCSIKSCPGDLLCYVLDLNSEIQSAITAIADKYKFRAYFANSKAEDSDIDISDRVQPPVEQWLRGFVEAKCVFTDSFHACAFSIIFNKPFWVIGNKERGNSRFSSLLQLFNLEDRLINLSDLKIVDFDKPINWESVNEKKQRMQDKSMSFLYECLKNGKYNS